MGSSAVVGSSWRQRRARRSRGSVALRPRLSPGLRWKCLECSLAHPLGTGGVRPYPAIRRRIPFTPPQTHPAAPGPGDLHSSMGEATSTPGLSGDRPKERIAHVLEWVVRTGTFGQKAEPHVRRQQPSIAVVGQIDHLILALRPSADQVHRYAHCTGRQNAVRSNDLGSRPSSARSV